MDLLRIAPNIEVKPDHIHGCTAFPAQLLVLFAYRRCVTVDRQRQQVLVRTRWFWFWHSSRSIPFDRVSRIIYRAQGLPSLSLARYLMSSDVCDSAFFLISIAVKDAVKDRHAHDELTLFTVWEQQPRERDWIDKLAGVRSNPDSLGDECAGAIVDLLREYLGVPITSH
jgi:hypothetical protein